MKLIATTLVLYYLYICHVSAASINIHVRLDNQLNNRVLKYYSIIKQYAPNDQIDFVNTQYPHITLYLTQFLDNATDLVVQT
jgi:hypothetical protein